MISPQLLKVMYTDTYEMIMSPLKGISEAQSLDQPADGGNCINWIVGHITVARVNFMMLLDVPPIWTMDICRKYIPGSAAITNADQTLPIDRLIADLAGTQNQLLNRLSTIAPEKLQEINDEKTIGAHLAFYNSHEAFHAGQLDLLGNAEESYE
ncbi:MAG: DinB family protein [Chloroflexota bacterium]